MNGCTLQTRRILRSPAASKPETRPSRSYAGFMSNGMLREARRRVRSARRLCTLIAATAIEGIADCSQQKTRTRIS